MICSSSPLPSSKHSEGHSLPRSRPERQAAMSSHEKNSTFESQGSLTYKTARFRFGMFACGLIVFFSWNCPSLPRVAPPWPSGPTWLWRRRSSRDRSSGRSTWCRWAGPSPPPPPRRSSCRGCLPRPGWSTRSARERGHETEGGKKKENIRDQGAEISFGLVLSSFFYRPMWASTFKSTIHCPWTLLTPWLTAWL